MSVVVCCQYNYRVGGVTVGVGIGLYKLYDGKGGGSDGGGGGR